MDVRPPHHLSALFPRFVLREPPTGLDLLCHEEDDLAFSVTPEVNDLYGAGILTRLPSPTLFSLGLGTDSPWADYPSPGTLGLLANVFFTRFIATHACIFTSSPLSLLLREERSPTDPEDPAASVTCLSPDEFSAQARSTSELLRFLLRVAASKPTSWLSERSHILSHLACT